MASAQSYVLLKNESASSLASISSKKYQPSDDHLCMKVEGILKRAAEEGLEEPEYLWMAHRKNEAGKWNPDHDNVSANPPPADADAYPGYVLLELRSEAVWLGKIFTFVKQASSILADIQADVQLSFAMLMMPNHYPIPLKYKIMYVGTFLLSLILTCALGFRAALSRKDVELELAKGICAAKKFVLFRAMLLEILDVPEDLLEVRMLMQTDKYHGTVSWKGHPRPLISLGVEAQRNYKMHARFLTLLPSAVMEDGVCLCLLIYIYIAYLGISKIDSAIALSMLSSLIRLIMHGIRGVQWFHAFRACRDYRVVRASDENMPEEVRKITSAELAKMRAACPIL